MAFGIMPRMHPEELDSRPVTENDVDWSEVLRALRVRIAQRLQSRPSEVDDLAQEAAIRLMRALRREPAHNLEALMTTICQRTLLDSHRRHHRWSLIQVADGEAVLESVPSQDTAPDAFGDPLHRTRFVILEFFESTNAACRKLAKDYYRGLTWKAVAEQVGKSEAAVRKQWSRCLEMLRQAVPVEESLQPLRDWLGA